MTPHTDAPVPHVFVAGTERALRLLRRAVPSLFISHLPIEGEGCVDTLRRNHRRVVWLSPWAVSHADFISARLDACFVVIDSASTVDPAQAPPDGCRCLHLSESQLAGNPELEVRRLLEFLGAALEEPIAAAS
jgi:hypothetical protein